MLNEIVFYILRSKLYDKSTYQGSIIFPNMYLNQVQMYFGEKTVPLFSGDNLDPVSERIQKTETDVLLVICYSVSGFLCRIQDLIIIKL